MVHVEPEVFIRSSRKLQKMADRAVGTHLAK